MKINQLLHTEQRLLIAQRFVNQPNELIQVLQSAIEELFNLPMYRPRREGESKKEYIQSFLDRLYRHIAADAEAIAETDKIKRLLIVFDLQEFRPRG